MRIYVGNSGKDVIILNERNDFYIFLCWKFNIRFKDIEFLFIFRKYI